MPGKDLRLPERAALLALMGMGREVSNPELRELTGLTLTGKERLRLNQEGLVTSWKVGQPYVHELTDKGWRWCADELGATCPPRAGSGGGALYAVLAGLGRFLDRSGLTPADVFGPGEPAAPAPAAAAAPVTDSGDLEAAVKAAYRRLAGRPGAFVSLTQLRSLLGEAARDNVDAVLRRMSRNPSVNIIPQANQKLLTPADRDAAVRIGEQDNHQLSIEEEP